MISIDLSGIPKAIALAQTRLRDQVPFAVANAINDTALAVQTAQIREMRDVFDRPKPNTLDAVYVKRATKQTLTAEVGLKDFAGKGIAASKYLAAQIAGGSRRPKRFEVALIRAGVMPAGYRAVPGQAAQMDDYGNMKGSQIVQILAFFRAFPEAGYKANMDDKGRARLLKSSKKSGFGFTYFVGRPADGKLPFGIWQRFQFKSSSGTAIKPVILFVPHANYQAIFDFEYVASKTVEREFSNAFDKRLREAMETAR